MRLFLFPFVFFIFTTFTILLHIVLLRSVRLPAWNKVRDDDDDDDELRGCLLTCEIEEYVVLHSAPRADSPLKVVRLLVCLSSSHCMWYFSFNCVNYLVAVPL